jgi:hypothetical protein
MTVSEKEMLFRGNAATKADVPGCDSDLDEYEMSTFRTRPQRRLCHLDLRACAPL